MPASFAEFARANNNERSSAAWKYWNYFNGNDMSAWPKKLKAPDPQSRRPEVVLGEAAD
jgi:hypothetical protein